MREVASPPARADGWSPSRARNAEERGREAGGLAWGGQDYRRLSAREVRQRCSGGRTGTAL